MSTLQHGQVTVDVPDDWLDHSTLLFVQPRGAVQTVPAPAVTPTFSVRFAHATHLAARKLVELELSQLEIIQPALSRLDAEEIQSSLGTGWLQRVRLALLDVPVEQWIAAWVCANFSVIATASCEAREAEREREHMERLLRGIRLTAR